jgi:hypothetical protein
VAAMLHDVERAPIGANDALAIACHRCSDARIRSARR